MKRIYAVALIIIVMTMPLYADASLSLNITFPSNPDTFSLEKVRLSGNTLPGAHVYVNDKPVKVYPYGAFVTRVELEDGENLIRVRANKGDQQTVQEIVVLRPPKLVETDTVETVIDTLYQVPDKDVMVLPGDYVRVKFKGTPGGDARFSIEKIADEVPMIELPPGKAFGMRGIYSGIVQVHDGPRNRPLDIECELRGKDGKRKKIKLSGQVFIMSDDVPVVAETREETWLLNTADGFIPKSLMQEETLLHIVGKTGDRFKVRLGHGKYGYVDDQKVTLLSWGTDIPRARISAPILAFDEQYLKLRFSADIQVPVTIASDPASKDIVLTWYGAQQSSHWITYPNIDTGIKNVAFSYPEEGILQASITPESKDYWGFCVHYDESGYHVKILKAPERPNVQDSSFLKGLTLVLDPGHGGEYEGAVGPMGFLEKEVNLLWAQVLKDSLEKYGAQVVLTRNADETVSLKERVDIARRQKAHLLLSLHNNSTTPGGNALSARGTSVYFYHPHNKDLAWAIYPYMVDLGLAPYGRIYNSYYITRVTDMPVLLIEGAFLSHPDEEQKFTDPKFLHQLSGAVIKGLRDFLTKPSADQ